MGAENIFKQTFLLKKDIRRKNLGQNPKLIWFSGLSGSGKSTLSNLIENELFKMGFKTSNLDGDNLRHGLCNDLGFSEKDRTENIRRVAELSKLMLDSGLIVLASFITPMNSQIEIVRKIVGKKNFVHIYISTPLKECEKRDVKGLYKKARSGKIENFTGVSSKFEKPINPDLIIDTSNISINESIKTVLKKIMQKL